MTQRKRLGECTAKERIFAAAIVAGKKAADAYREAYTVGKMTPEQVRVEAGRVRKRHPVRRLVEQLQQQIAEKVVLEQAEIVREIHRLALADPIGIVDEQGRLKLLHQVDARTRAAIASFEITDKGGVKYRFFDKNSALDKACKILGLYELDNKQKADPLAELLARLSGNVVGVTTSNAASLPDDDDQD